MLTSFSQRALEIVDTCQYLRADHNTMATWGCRHCTYENEHGMTVCAVSYRTSSPAPATSRHNEYDENTNGSTFLQICGNPNLAAEGAPSSDIEFELFRDILDEIRRDAGGGFDVDAALEQIAVMLGAADVPSLLMSVGPRGLEYVPCPHPPQPHHRLWLLFHPETRGHPLLRVDELLLLSI